MSENLMKTEYQEVKIEHLLGVCNYIFEMTELKSTDMPLSYLRYYLANIQDLIIIDKIIDYEVPNIFTIITNNGITYLYICVFPGKVNPKDKQAIANLDKLLAFTPILTRPARMPHLMSLLFRGAVTPPEKITTILELTPENICDIDIVDIFFVLGAPGTGKSTAAKILISKLLCAGTENIEKSQYSPQTYSKRLQLNNRPDYCLVEEIEKISRNIEEFVFDKKTLANMLLDIQILLFGRISGQLMIELDKIILELSKPAKSIPPTLLRLIKNIYALPANEIAYSDNGDNIIYEALLRLESIETMKPYFVQLSDIRKTYDGSTQWFSKLGTFCENILAELVESKSDYVTKEQKQRFKDLMKAVVSHLIMKINEQSKENDIIFDDFINELTNNPDATYPYIQDYPVLLYGTLIIDLDTCHNEDIILKEMMKADRIILFCSYLNEFNLTLFNAARTRQEHDGKARLAGFCNSHRHPPVLADFVSRNFYEVWGMPPLKSMVEQIDEPAFIWIRQSSIMLNFAAHLADRLNSGFSVAVFLSQIVSFQEYLLANGFSDKEKNSIFIGSDVLYCHDEFDAVYYVYDTKCNNQHFCAALGRAKKMLIVVGDPDQIVQGTPLHQFYQRCVGDTKHGKFYG